VPLSIPRNLAEAAEIRGREQWIATLPATVRTLEKRWAIEIGEPYQPGGQTAWVAPARSTSFGDVVLKIACRHFEAYDEAKGLREWNGEGAVRLLAAEDLDALTSVLLIERCVPGVTLAARSEQDQDLVISELLPRLWKEPPFREQFRPLQAMCDQWADGAESVMSTNRPELDAGLLREGVSLMRSLPASSERDVLLCTDLHAENVLAAEREPWLMIDPKPYVGDATFDSLQHLLNCEGRLLSDPISLARDMAGLLELDLNRLLLWLFARCVVELPHWPSLADVVRKIAPA
jgi:streptomycin 6-kinase